MPEFLRPKQLIFIECGRPFSDYVHIGMATITYRHHTRRITWRPLSTTRWLKRLLPPHHLILTHGGIILELILWLRSVRSLTRSGGPRLYTL